MKTTIINNVEYELEQHDNGKMLSEIIIPKGWRLLLPSEAMMLFERGLIDKTFWIFVKQTNKKEEKRGHVTVFYGYPDRVDLYCYRRPSSSYASLGVILARDLEEK